jgi:hypothetical protein
MKLEQHVKKLLGVDMPDISVEEEMRSENPDFVFEYEHEGPLDKRLRTEEVEAIKMDLKDVTVQAISEGAILFSKKGYQKWVPKSAIEDITGINKGDFLTDIILTANGKNWIPDKLWKKLELR